MRKFVLIGVTALAAFTAGMFAASLAPQAHAQTASRDVAVSTTTLANGNVVAWVVRGGVVYTCTAIGGDPTNAPRCVRADMPETQPCHSALRPMRRTQ
jgi:uncharacterized protein HemY